PRAPPTPPPRDPAHVLTLATAPLTRLATARLSATEVQVIWTFHHLLLDGWSIFHVLTDTLTTYTALTTSQPHPALSHPPRTTPQPRPTGTTPSKASTPPPPSPTTGHRWRRTGPSRRPRSGP